MIVSLVVAVTETGVIGAGNRIPWHLRDDFRHFKTLTLGHCLIMGRKTFASIGKPLPGRTSIVITRGGWAPPAGVLTAGSLAAALGQVPASAAEVFVAGGAQVYRMAWARADRIYLTVVRDAGTVTGDTYFPVPPATLLAQWDTTPLGHHDADAQNDYPFDLYRLSRRPDTPRDPPAA